MEDPERLDEMKGTEDYDDEVYADHFRQPEEEPIWGPSPLLTFWKLMRLNEYLERTEE